MNEEWKVYKVCKDKWGNTGKVYEVSNFGNVKCDGNIIEPREGRYLAISNFYVHRAVAELFVPNLENKPEVDHIDTDRHNNVYTNLRWTTRKENANNPLTKINKSNALKGRTSPNKGVKMSDEQKKKISDAHKGIKHKEEAKEKIRLAHLGTKRGPLSEEVKEKIRLSNVGKKHKHKVQE